MRHLIIYILMGTALSALAQDDLARRANFGFRFKLLSDAADTYPDLKGKEGFVADEVMPGTSLDALGVKPGDVLMEINGVEVKGYQTFKDPKLSMYHGDPLKVKVYRDGKMKELMGKAVERPREQSENHQTIYGSVPFEGGTLRTIVTKPNKEGKQPAVLFIPGFSCFSLDNLPGMHPYRKFVDQLTDVGYVVLRVEKPGVGDCQGTGPCDEIDFPTEVRAFMAGYEAMRDLDFVDTNQLFIFGHSLGGVEAPLVAAKYQPKGVMVYGTSHVPWHEYLVQMMRVQSPRMGQDWVEHNADMRKYIRLFYDLHVNKMSVDELIEQDPDNKRLLEASLELRDGKILGRSVEFSQTLSDADVVKGWAETSSHVLSLFGEGDIQAVNSQSHQDIAVLINHYNPGHGTFKVLPETDHSFIKVGSMEASYDAYNSGDIRRLTATSFNSEIISVLDEWMQKVLSSEEAAEK